MTFKKRLSGRLPFTLKSRLFNLIAEAPTLIYVSGAHNSGSATVMLSIFTDEVVFSIILSTFSRENGITVP